MKVSIAICTWNRAQLLDQTLVRFRDMTSPPGVEWELLVVNNNSTDDTDRVIDRHIPHLPIRRLMETEQGHCHARNCAIDAATGEWILWTDDDVLVDKTWLSEYASAFEQFPGAAFFGGTVDPWFAVEPPAWIRRHLERVSGPFAIRSLGNDVRALTAAESPYGASMGFRLETLRSFRFNPRLGRKGLGMLSGDETDVIERMRRAGHTGVWVGTARVRHFIPAERLTKKYLWEWSRGMGRAMAVQNSGRDCKQLFGAPRWAVWKYLRSRVVAWSQTPFKGPRWLSAFRDAAVCQGIIEESRAASTAAVVT